MCCGIQEHFLPALLSRSSGFPAPGGVSRTCTTAPLLFIGIPSCGFLPFYFFVSKFTFLTSVNLQFGSCPPEPFTSCRERSNVDSPTFDIPDFP